MFEVTIYLEVSFRGPAYRTAAGMWLIEYIKKDGSLETRQGMVCGKKMTENGLALEALTMAFERLRKSCSVRVITRCDHVLNVTGNDWLPQWEKNGWLTAKGKFVKNMTFWQKVAEAHRKHLVSYENTWNSYGENMQDTMQKGLELLGKTDATKIIYELDKEMNFKEVKRDK